MSSRSGEARCELLYPVTYLLTYYYFHFLPHFNSKTTGLIFTNVDALVPLLIRAYTNDVAFCLGMPEQRAKTVNFNVCKKAPN